MATYKKLFPTPLAPPPEVRTMHIIPPTKAQREAMARLEAALHPAGPKVQVTATYGSLMVRPVPVQPLQKNKNTGSKKRNRLTTNK